MRESDRVRPHERRGGGVVRRGPVDATAAPPHVPASSRDAASPALLSARGLLQLQRRAGNAAVVGVVQRTRAPGSTCAGPGGCACTGCRDEDERQRPAPGVAGTVQRAPMVGGLGGELGGGLGGGLIGGPPGGGAVQRQPKGAATPAPGTVPEGYAVRHNPSRQHFTDDPAEVRKKLEGFLAQEKDVSALEYKFHNDGEFVGPVRVGTLMPVCDLDPGTCFTYQQKVVRLVQSEARSLKSRVAAFADDFRRRANDTLLLLLNDSEEKINREKERYGLQKKEKYWGLVTEYSLNNAGALTDAAKALLGKYLALKTATDELKTSTDLGASGSTEDPGRPALPPGGTEGMRTAEDRAQAEAKVKEREKEYTLLRKQKEDDHPILVTYDLDAGKEGTHGVLSALAADSGETKAELLHKHVDEKLKNIKTTRDHVAGHPGAIWKLPTVVGVTQKLPDIAGHPALPGKELQKVAIDDATSQVSMAEAIEAAALAAVAIGLGLLTAGAATAGMTVVAGAGVVTGAGLGVAQTLSAIRQFEFEQAATNTDLHGKAQSISQEDPSLFWLAVEVVSTVVDLKAAASEFKGILRMSRGATAAKMAKDPEAQRLLDELRDKGKAVTGKQEVGDRLRLHADKLSASVAQDADEIATNLDKIRPSTHPDYTHEIPLDGGRFWRRSPTGSWCVFASPPRCAVGVIDQLVTGAPWLSGISIDTFASLMSNRNALKAAKKDARAGKLLEKYGVDAVRTMEHAAFHGEFPVELMVRFDAVSHIPGSDRLLIDLASGSTTTKGAIGELTYIEMLLKKGEKIERIADMIDGQKAADIVLKDKRRTVIDMKYIDWTHWRWKLPGKVEEKAQEYVRQVARRRKEYKDSPIVYVFAGELKDVPAPIVKALKNEGVTVRGTI